MVIDINLSLKIFGRKNTIADMENLYTHVNCSNVWVDEVWKK